jgi:hypothetical protein
LIFTCAFGISANAALYPDNSTDNTWYNIIRKFFDFAYWPIFGDTSNLKELKYDFCEYRSWSNNSDNKSSWGNNSNNDGQRSWGNKNDTDSKMPCPNKSGQIYAYILFIIYIIIMNGLIANLLITIFG